MSDFIKTLISVVEQIQQWPVSVALVVCLVAIGYVMKFIGLFPNKYIPPTLIILAVALNMSVGDRSKIDPNQRNPLVVLAIYGVLLGFVAWVAHALALKRFERFLSGRKSEPEELEDTETEIK